MGTNINSAERQQGTEDGLETLASEILSNNMQVQASSSLETFSGETPEKEITIPEDDGNSLAISDSPDQLSGISSENQSLLKETGASGLGDDKVADTPLFAQPDDALEAQAVDPSGVLQHNIEEVTPSVVVQDFVSKTNDLSHLSEALDQASKSMLELLTQVSSEANSSAQSVHVRVLYLIETSIGNVSSQGSSVETQKPAEGSVEDVLPTVEEVDPVVKLNGIEDAYLEGVNRLGALKSLVGIGDVLRITLDTVDVVTVFGVPLLEISVGLTDKKASYVEGSGTDQLIFEYIVEPGDKSLGSSIPIKSLTLPEGATISGLSGEILDLGALLPIEVETGAAFVVDAVPPPAVLALPDSIPDGQISQINAESGVWVRLGLPRMGEVAGDKVVLNIPGTNGGMSQVVESSITEFDIVAGVVSVPVSIESLRGAGDGSKLITAKLIDNAGNIGPYSDIAYVEVDLAAPVFQSPLSSNISENQVEAYSALAYDNKGSVSYQLTGGEDAELFSIDSSSGAVVFQVAPDFEVPADQGGDNVYNIQVSATDLFGNRSHQDVQIAVVGDVPEAPVSQKIPPSFLVVGTPYSADISRYFSDLDSGDVLSFSAEGLPEGLSIENQTGMISGVVSNPLSSLAHIKVTAVDSLGLTAEQSFALEMLSSAKLFLRTDSGIIGDDVTNDALVKIAGLLPGADWRYSLDSGMTWDQGAGAELLLSGDGPKNLIIRQNSLIGQDAAVEEVSIQFVLDSQVSPPLLSLERDSGVSASDGTTNEGKVLIEGTEPSATVQYSLDGGLMWHEAKESSLWLKSEGEKNLLVRQIDVASNVSEPSFMRFYLDSEVASPIVSLESDTGFNEKDHITKNNVVLVQGTEQESYFEYSSDGGTVWETVSGSSFAVSGDGEKNILVHQIDLAGNVSRNVPFRFVLDSDVGTPTAWVESEYKPYSSFPTTNKALIYVGNIASGAQVEYREEGALEWQTLEGKSISVNSGDGQKHLFIQQTDIAGNVSDPLSFTFVLDTVALPPRLALSADSGVSHLDKITHVGVIDVSRVEVGALAQYSLDDQLTWQDVSGSTITFSDDGQKSVYVRQIDAAGNISIPAYLDFLLDTSVKAPDISLEIDSGIDSNDRVTQEGALQLVEVEPGATVEYKIGDGDWQVTSENRLVLSGEGLKVVSVRQVDLAGNTSEPSYFSFTLDTRVDALGLSITNDSGAQGDFVTNDGSFQVHAAEIGSIVEYQLDGGDWQAIDGDSFRITGDGERLVSVRQIDIAGNVSKETSLVVVLDSFSKAPTPSLLKDSGVDDKDLITNIGAVGMEVFEVGAVVEYSLDGQIWEVLKSSSLSFNKDSEISIFFRQTDIAGNHSDATSFSFVLDTSVGVPVASLEEDSGVSNTDSLTNNQRVILTQIEKDALVEYSLDGIVWNKSDSASGFSLEGGDGLKTVLIRQYDLAGNESDPVSLSFTLDTSAAQPTILLQSRSGVGSAGLITNSTEVKIGNLESNATLQYGFDGENWTNTTENSFPVLGDGLKTVYVRQVDSAGNISSVSSATYTLDTAITKPSLYLEQDSGQYTDDLLTNNGNVIAVSPEEVSVFEFSSDGGETWQSVQGYVLHVTQDGIKTILVRQIDLAGNVSDPDQITFRLDREALAPKISLESDTGVSNDLISQNGVVVVEGLEPDARFEYSVNGGAWQKGQGSAFNLEGDEQKVVEVHQIDLAGNTSQSTLLTFTLDTKTDLVLLSLQKNHQISNGYTNTGIVQIQGREVGASVEIRENEESPWQLVSEDSFILEGSDGVKTIYARQIDAAGNIGEAASFRFVLDTQAPDPVTVRLNLDSGKNENDLVTSDATVGIEGLEEAGRLQTSLDGVTWTDADPQHLSFAGDGEKSIFFRQLDLAGNPSEKSSITYILDTVVNSPSISQSSGLALDDISVLTSDKTFTVGGLEEEATFEYQLNNGEWVPGVGNEIVLSAHGPQVLSVRQIDLAGNVSQVHSASFTLTTPSTQLTLKLAEDSGRSDSDSVTNVGKLRLEGVQKDVTLEVLEKPDAAWYILTTPTVTISEEGEHTVFVREVDFFANILRSDSITFTLDKTALPLNFALEQDLWLGSPDADEKPHILKIQGAEPGALIQIQDGENSEWQILEGDTFAVPGEGSRVISARQIDIAGNVSQVTSMQLHLDRTVAPITLTLEQDSGFSDADRITNSNVLLVHGREPDSLVEIQEDGGQWKSLTEDVLRVKDEGAKTVSVRQTDLAGNLSEATNFSFTLDHTVAPMTVVLAEDTGVSDTDRITNSGVLELIGKEPKALVQVQEESGMWRTITEDVLRITREGDHTVFVRQTDLAGNVSEVNLFSFTLDKTVEPLNFSFEKDLWFGTEANSSNEPSHVLKILGIEPGALVEIKDGKDSLWQVLEGDTFAVSGESQKTISVRQTDVAGNVSDITSTLLRLDTTIVPITVALAQDTGVSDTDRITNSGVLVLTGKEPKALVEVQEENGTWRAMTKDVLSVTKEGENTVFVRQTDLAGNVSETTSFTFVLDHDVHPITVALAEDTGTSSTDRLTSSGVLKLEGRETGAVVEVQEEGGSWRVSTEDVLPVLNGRENKVFVRQTDLAGNVSEVTSFVFTLDRTVEPLSFVLDKDLWFGKSDGGISPHTLQIRGIETDATVEIQDGEGSQWKVLETDTFQVLGEGQKTISIRQTDLAGNLSVVTSMSVRVDSIAQPMSIRLSQDTGKSDSDSVTNSGVLLLQGRESGALVEIRENNGAWQVAQDDTVRITGDGEKTVSVRQTDSSENVSEINEIKFFLDTQVLSPRVFVVPNSDTERTIKIEEAEPKARLQYSLNQGIDWNEVSFDSFSAPVEVEVLVRQIDLAGNQSEVVHLAAEEPAPSILVSQLIDERGVLQGNLLSQDYFDELTSPKEVIVTDDRSLSFVGTLTHALKDTQVLSVYFSGEYVGKALVDETDWTFSSKLNPGKNAVEFRVEDPAVSKPMSSLNELSVELVADENPEFSWIKDYQLEVQGSNRVLDLTAVDAVNQPRIDFIDLSDFSGTGSNSVKIDLSDVLSAGVDPFKAESDDRWVDLTQDVSDGRHQLLIQSNGGGTVTVAGDHWEPVALVKHLDSDLGNDHDYYVYNHGADAQLLIDSSLVLYIGLI